MSSIRASIRLPPPLTTGSTPLSWVLFLQPPSAYITDTASRPVPPAEVRRSGMGVIQQCSKKWPLYQRMADARCSSSLPIARETESDGSQVPRGTDQHRPRRTAPTIPSPHRRAEQRCRSKFPPSIKHGEATRRLT